MPSVKAVQVKKKKKKIEDILKEKEEKKRREMEERRKQKEQVRSIVNKLFTMLLFGQFKFTVGK